MSEQNIDFKKLIKEAVIEGFDKYAFEQEVVEDIQNNNPEWWAEKVVEPLREAILNTLLKKEELIKIVIAEILDREFPYEKIEKLIYRKAEERMEQLLPRIKVEIDQ